jgi:hypothetical protein
MTGSEEKRDTPLLAAGYFIRDRLNGRFPSFPYQTAQFLVDKSLTNGKVT